VIDEVGDSDEETGEPRMVIVRESPQDDPSFEASRLVFVEETKPLLPFLTFFCCSVRL
jgi:hypothetical protein